MTGIVLGILSALVWGIAGVTGSLASRRIGAAAAIGWAMLLSMIAAVPLALLSGAPGRVDVRTALWILLRSFTARDACDVRGFRLCRKWLQPDPTHAPARAQRRPGGR